MIKWLHRLVLFFSCAILLIMARGVDILAIAACLCAFTLACFTGALAARWASIGCCLLWGVLSLLQPMLGFFWPLIAYDLILQGCLRFLAVPGLALLLLPPGGPWAFDPLLLCLAGLASLMGLQSRRNTDLGLALHALRDEAMEANLSLARKNSQLQEAQDAQVRLATLSERSRIARDIHDNAGHLLARCLMQTGALMTLNKDPGLAQGLEGLRGSLTLAMNTMRDSVHNLRDESLDLHAIVAASLPKTGRMACRLNYDIGPDAPRSVQLCFAAVVREAVANAQKHSDATRMTIDLLEHPAFYQLRVEDNGHTAGHAPGSGMGLDNMRERTEALGGRFTLSRQNGYRIHIAIPKAGTRKEGAL